MSNVALTIDSPTRKEAISIFEGKHHPQHHSPNALVANVTTSNSPSVTPTWLFDSGASNHVTGDRSTLHNVSNYGGPDEIILGDSTATTTAVSNQPQSASISSHIHHPLFTASTSTQPKTPATFRITYSWRKTKPVKTTPPPTTSTHPTSPDTSPSSQP
ncbi:hypothetical protein E3N88_05384 [Mikania micrantha]|uniref:Uncharacterized protein n=1 Tax=Mikania micrantha TaxID=192012 RepID=A0A5N6PKU7_9ASTR|nr:hypothetical protein E3N88_05384 [Mikania micrantha]